MKLTQSQLEQLLSNTRLSDDGKDLYALCPFCAHDEFGISIVQDNNPYRCFRAKNCGQIGNIYTLLKHLGKVKEFIGEKEIDIDGQLPALQEEEQEQERVELPIVDPPVGWVRCVQDEYLTLREFKDYQFDKFKVGRSRFKRDYVTFLVEMNQRVVGYISRHTWSKERIDKHNSTHNNPILRYQNSVSDFSRMLFGYDEIIEGVTTDVILVEGVFSKTKTDTNLALDYNFDAMKCCATFGAKISKEQIQLLKDKGVKTIWLWFEADVLVKLKKIAAELFIQFTDVRVSYLNGFDPGDIDSQQAIVLLENSLNWFEIDQNYI